MTVLGVALLAGASAATFAVLPPGTPPEREPAIRAALTELGWSDPTFVSGAELLGAVEVVRVVGLPGPDECDGRVPIEAWRAALQRARDALQLLAFTEAVAELVARDAELVCLSSPPALSDLFRLELAVAEAHTFLARGAGDDAGRRRFHEDEARAALVRAAAFGAALSLPADLPPDVLQAYDRARRRADDDPPRVVVAGPGARVGARFNGRPLPEGVFDAIRGANLVQAADGAEVTAAARVPLDGGRTLVWLDPDGEGAEPSLGAALRSVGRGVPAGDAAALLVAAARLLGGDVLYVRDAGTSVGAFEVGSWGLQDRGAVRVSAPAIDAWRAVIGAGPSVGWTDLDAGPLEGLGGAHAGAAIYARIGVTDLLAVAATVDPWAVAAPIPDAQGGGVLFRGTIPATVGVRFGPRTRRLAAEAGLDVGVHAFGSFTEGGERTSRASLLARGAAGVSVAIGPRVAARLQGTFGAGLSYVGGDATLGLEGRL